MLDAQKMTDVDSAPYARAREAGTIPPTDTTPITYARARGADQGHSDGDRDGRTGRFVPGNRAWEARSISAGPAPKYTDGESLWKACEEYFCWVEDNPVYETQHVTFQGLTKHERVPRTRAMTKRDLCQFLRVARTTWNAWYKNPDLAETVERVEMVIYGWNFTGAAAGLLDPTILARQLGLANRMERPRPGAASKP